MTWIGHCYQSWIISGLELASTVLFLDNLLLDTVCESVMVNVCLREKLKTEHLLQDTQYLMNSLSVFSCFTGPFTCGSQLGHSDALFCLSEIPPSSWELCLLVDVYVCCFGETPLECGIWLCAHWPVTGSEGACDGFLISISMPSIVNMGSLLFGLMYRVWLYGTGSYLICKLVCYHKVCGV
jgi:hypothetical protein